MSIELLSPPMRKFIRDKGWKKLRPIQYAAITRILSSDKNFILASRAASGKTEAAFLPILSKLNFNDPGVQVLYISPLIALINQQFSRIEDICHYLNVAVTKWHGEASRSLKNKLLSSPSGIVLITPESLEAMFVNRPFYIKELLSNLKYIVIDEIHSFLGTDRGVHLKSILSRLQQDNPGSYSIVGLSATIGDYDEAKSFTGNKANTRVLLDKTRQKIKVTLRFFQSRNNLLSQELIKDLYIKTKDRKVLVFPNNRGRSEEIAVKLKEISRRLNGHQNYFSHHSSVDKEEREFIEHFAKSIRHENFCISCTSTLELGIDIGSIDEIVQIDSSHRVDSLVQRVGRSGRIDGGIGCLNFYATTQWSLLQSIACWLLYEEGFLEVPAKNQQAYDILVHQALSITKQYSGISSGELIAQLEKNFAFHTIPKSEIEEILQHLIDINLLERLQHELLIGIEGEKIVNSREFYSVFKTEDNYKVLNAGHSIGNIPFSAQLFGGENIFLSAKIWKIVFVDRRGKKIEVVPASDGKKPLFFGDASAISQEIREKMLLILYSRNTYEFLDKAARDELDSMRREFSVFAIENLLSDRPLLRQEKHLQLFTFTGTRINQTLHFLLDIAGIKNTLDESCSCLHLEVSEEAFLLKWQNIHSFSTEFDLHIIRILEARPELLGFSKWGIYLPVDFQVKVLKNKFFDIDATLEYLSRFKPVTADKACLNKKNAPEIF